MSNASKFRKKAVEYEQLKQFDRAVASYVRAIEENESAGEDVDVALFNKVGDLTLRQGRVTEAVTYYERAVDHYVSSGLFDNAIALCNKILRNAPGRSNVYFTLGRICGRKGLRSDATRNFLEYATRMQAEGRVDEGMRALAEVADLMPELTEVGRLVQEHAVRAGIALPQRRKVTPPIAAPAQQTNAAGKAFGLSKDLVFLDIEYDAPKAARQKTPPPVSVVRLTPPIVPSTIVAVQDSDVIDDEQEFDATIVKEMPAHAEADESFVNDLVASQDIAFIEVPIELPLLVDAVMGGQALEDPFINAQLEESQHTAVAHDEPAADESVRDFDDMLIFDPATSNGVHTHVTDVAIPSAFFIDAENTIEPESVLDAENAIGAEYAIDAEDTIELGYAGSTFDPAVSQPVEIESITTPDVDFIALTDASVTDEFETIALPVEASAIGEPIALPTDADDLLNDDDSDVAVDSGALEGFDSEDHLHAPEVHVTGNYAAVPSPDVLVEPASLGVLDLDAMLNAPENHVAPIDDLEAEEFESANDDLAAKMFAHVDDEASIAYTDAFTTSEELPALIFPMPFDAYPLKSDDAIARALSPQETDALFSEPALYEETYSAATFDPPTFDDIAFEAPSFDLPSFEEPTFDTSSFADSPDDDEFARNNEPTQELPFLVPEHAFDTPPSTVTNDASVESDLDALFFDATIPTAIVAAEAAAAASSRRDELQKAVAEAPTDWTLRRRLAEALFEAGERDAAIGELSAALSGHEHANALVEAAEIADELVRVAGDQIAHHQKRVELAIRLGDQNRLREAYLDLADDLVRKNDDLRARAVYARVLEIDPWDDRARTALGDAAPPPPERIVAGSDDDKIDLAAWLRDDDEPQSTRLRMREPEMSGNEQDDFNSLLKHFKEGVARSLGEDDHDSHYDLGVAYKEMGLLDDAIGEFQKALRSRNNRLAAYEALGQCFLEQQSYKVAVTVLSRALHEPAIRDEQRVGVLYLLGYSCEALQRFDEARSYFQRVYATDIHFRDVAQRLADLERIAS